MARLSFPLVVSLFIASAPAMAQSEEHREHSAMQHIGGHGRHMHRDWSETGGRGHVHNICWQWDAVEGWVWTCR